MKKDKAAGMSKALSTLTIQVKSEEAPKTSFDEPTSVWVPKKI